MNFRPSKHDRPVFGKIASEYNLTYYGTVVPTESNDYIPVRGITASPEQVDENYTVGEAADYTIRLLQRSHDVYLEDNRKLNKTWTICQVDLRSRGLPHVIMSSRLDEAGNSNVLASYLRMYEIAFARLDCVVTDDFASKFAIYASPQDVPTIEALLTPDFQAMLSVHFGDTDFELDDDKLYVYNNRRPIQLVDLDKQLRIAIWLAKFIDGIN